MNAGTASADTSLAGLRYVCDRDPGIRRVRRGRGFVYRDADGQAVSDVATLERIRQLAIPPAWTDVWICGDAGGHLQATGRDLRGRKQYRYHLRWSEARNATKFERLADFGRLLPVLRARVDADLARPGLTRDKVLAAVVRLLETTAIRVGNAEYARANASFGLTTLRDEHVDVKGADIAFHFRGKSGRLHDVRWQDPRLARIVRRCQELPGQELFQYVDAGGAQCVVASTDVNDYLRDAIGEGFSAKDFRTWTGSVAALVALQRLHQRHPRRIKRNIVAAVKEVAAQLANTPAVCRRHYIHPDIIAAYENGAIGGTRWAPARGAGLARLSADERVLLGFLRRYRRARATNGPRRSRRSAR